jgi:D-3-phosphoglycerate dehydrogenase
VEWRDLDDLSRESDVVALTTILTESTKGLVGRRLLSLMKPTALLVNTSRGSVLDEQAVADALRAGQLAGAGLDVFEEEPVPPGSLLRTLENVIFTDHAGWYSEESVVELKTKAAQNVAAVLAGGAPVYPVNAV